MEEMFEYRIRTNKDSFAIKSMKDALAEIWACAIADFSF